MKEQEKTSEEELTKMEKKNLPNKEFKVMIVKTLKLLWRRENKQNDKLEFSIRSYYKIESTSCFFY